MPSPHLQGQRQRGWGPAQSHTHTQAGGPHYEGNCRLPMPQAWEGKVRRVLDFNLPGISLISSNMSSPSLCHCWTRLFFLMLHD